MAGVQSFVPEGAVCGWLAPTPFPEHGAGEALFEHLHNGRRISSLRLADQQMNGFRHHDVSQYDESVAAAHPLYDFEKQITPIGTGKQRTALVTTRGDEMQIS